MGWRTADCEDTLFISRGCDDIWEYVDAEISRNIPRMKQKASCER